MPVALSYSIIFCIVWWIEPARRALTTKQRRDDCSIQFRLQLDTNREKTEVTNRKCHSLPTAFCNPGNLLISWHQPGLKYPPQLWPRDPAAILVPWVALTNSSCLCALQDFFCLFCQACPYQRQAPGQQFQDMAVADANQRW